jgi:hypothetical protein
LLIKVQVAHAPRTEGSPSILSSVFAQACCAAVSPPSTQTIIQTGESSRVIQFALKLTF